MTAMQPGGFRVTRKAASDGGQATRRRGAETHSPVRWFPLGNVPLHELIKHLRTGLPATILGEASRYLGVPGAVLYAHLRLGHGAVEGKIGFAGVLSSAESDRMFRLARVVQRAAAVLGDPPSGNAWVRRKIRALGGVCPVSLLDTEAGYELVMDALGRIEHGIFA